jgi:hypothetical protein
MGDSPVQAEQSSAGFGKGTTSVVPLRP